MTYAVGHRLTAASYDRNGLEALHRKHGGATVGIEVGVSLLESELRMSWTARRRGSYERATVRGLVALLRAVSEAGPLRHRRPSLPPFWGRR
jgi:hypothetical protein